MGVNPPLPSPERGIFAICPILCAERKTTQKFVLCLKCTPKVLCPTFGVHFNPYPHSISFLLRVDFRKFKGRWYQTSHFS